MAAERKLNLAAGGKPFPPSEGWTNMDMLPLPGIDVVHNALDLPWPFPDGHFEHVETHHFFEHVPHGGWGQKDGFLAVMEEIHRVLAPDGTLRIVCPHPNNKRANLRDPTHTRVVVAENFTYFAPDHPNNYYTKARFRTENVRIRSWEPKAPRFLRIGPGGHGILVHLHHRLPFLRRLVARPFEAEYDLRKTPSSERV